MASYCVYLLETHSRKVICEFNYVREFECIGGEYLVLYFDNEGVVRINIKNIDFRIGKEV